MREKLQQIEENKKENTLMQIELSLETTKRNLIENINNKIKSIKSSIEDMHIKKMESFRASIENDHIKEIDYVVEHSRKQFFRRLLRLGPISREKAERDHPPICMAYSTESFNKYYDPYYKKIYLLKYAKKNIQFAIDNNEKIMMDMEILD